MTKLSNAFVRKLREKNDEEWFWKKEREVIERIDPNRLSDLLRKSNYLSEKECKAVRLLAKEMRGNQSHKVYYKKIEIIKNIYTGRLFHDHKKNKASVQSLPTNLRNYLFYDKNIVDIDIKGACLYITIELCDAANIECPKLKEFVSNRDELMLNLCKLFGLENKKIKNLFSSITFGGSISNWARICQVSEKLVPTWIKELSKELADIREQLFQLPVLSKYVYLVECKKKNKNIDFFNILGSAMSYLIYDFETMITWQMVDFAEKRLKLKTNSIIFDGAMFWYENMVTHEQLEAMEDFIRQTTPFKSIKLAIKPIEYNHLLDMSVSNLAISKPFYINNAKVVFDEVYCLHYMMSYSLSIYILCILAGMGLGKTNAVDDSINKLPFRARILIISYTQTLCHTFFERFEKYGFSHYKNVKDWSTDSDRLVICLDSILKIPVDCLNYDYVYIDEALSVFEHFSSTMMKHTAVCTSTLETILIKSKHLVLLDANLDCQMVVDVVNYLERKKKVKAHWVKNTFTRETNRKAKMLLNYSLKERITFVIDLLKDNKKVVIPVSSKDEGLRLHKKISLCFPEKKMKIYTSDTNKSEIMNDAKDINAAWKDLDVLIYSPTISAGISFTEMNFDVLVAFVISGQQFANMNSAMQQMFRVRQLKEGNMYVFLNVHEINEKALALTREDVERDFQNDSKNYSMVTEQYKHFGLINNQFNLQSFTFQILANIQLANNQSRAHPLSILKNAFSDNGIECSDMFLNEYYINKAKNIQIPKNLENKLIKDDMIHEFENGNRNKLTLSFLEIEEIDRKNRNNEDVPKNILVKKYITENLNKFKADIDKMSVDFFKQYILAVTNSDHERIQEKYCLFFRYLRLNLTIKNAYNRLHNNFAKQFIGECAITLDREIKKKGLLWEIEVKDILTKVFGIKDGNFKSIFDDSKMFKIVDIKQKMIEYLEAKSEEQYKSFLESFNLFNAKTGDKQKFFAYRDLAKFKTPRSKLAFNILNAIFKLTYNVNLECSSCYRFYKFENSYWSNITQNNATLLTNKHVLRFIKDEDEDDYQYEYDQESCDSHEREESYDEEFSLEDDNDEFDL